MRNSTWCYDDVFQYELVPAGLRTCVTLPASTGTYTALQGTHLSHKGDNRKLFLQRANVSGAFALANTSAAFCTAVLRMLGLSPERLDIKGTNFTNVQPKIQCFWK